MANTNKQVMRAFAQGRELEGTNVRSEFRGGILCFLSYSIVIAMRDNREHNVYRFTKQKYSRTTSKQMTLCKYECSVLGHTILDIV